MELKIFSLSNAEAGKMKMPAQFSEEVMPNLIKRAVLSLQSNARQPYGSDPMAGKRASAEVSRRRRKYRGSYGLGISRVPRKIFARRGTRMIWAGAFAPGTVSGRRAHPPKAEKIWSQKINKKENRKAIRSAISATIDRVLVTQRGHFAPDNYPFTVESKFEDLSKTKDVVEALQKLGFSRELERCSVKKVRAGKGKTRGRRYRKKKGPLLVVSKDCGLLKSARNITGVDVVTVNSLNAELLAPGTIPGRVTIWTDAALNRMEKESLFM
ncbi:50S ribosomal protein L4 [Candidatus Woesearchaeota archaeon]|nr:50S ribosomal protein L4 [Candidatus Woesearchaeota archaeon]